MDAIERQAMLDRDREEWLLLQNELDARREGAVHDPGATGWTSRDVYTHLAHMMDWTAEAIAARLSGERLPESDVELSEDEHNEWIRSQHAHMAFDEARAWAQAAFDRRIEAIGTIPLDRWDKVMHQIVMGDGWEHFISHRRWVAGEGA